MAVSPNLPCITLLRANLIYLPAPGKTMGRAAYAFAYFSGPSEIRLLLLLLRD